MTRAIQLAKDSLEFNEFPVGAVIISNDGQIISESANYVERNKQAIDHAECLVLQKAALIAGYRDLRDFVLISSLEPCQLCAEACSLYRIGGVVFGAYNHKKIYPAPADWIGGVSYVAAEQVLEGVFRDK